MVIAAAEIIHCVCIHCKLFQLHTAGGEENTADAAGFLRADGDTAHTGNTAVRIGLGGGVGVNCAYRALFCTETALGAGLTCLRFDGNAVVFTVGPVSGQI